MVLLVPMFSLVAVPNLWWSGHSESRRGCTNMVVPRVPSMLKISLAQANPIRKRMANMPIHVPTKADEGTAEPTAELVGVFISKQLHGASTIARSAALKLQP